MSKRLATLTKKFKDKEYRREYVNSFFDSLITAQIRALRKRGRLTQAQLGERTGTTQSGISAFESDEYSAWTINTLRKLASVFDVAVIVKFASYGEAAREIDYFGESTVLVPSFANDRAFVGTAEASSVTQEANAVLFEDDPFPWRSDSDSRSGEYRVA